MGYTTGQRVRHINGAIGTVTRDAAAHGVVFVRWDGTDSERQELPECVQPIAHQQASSVRDAWAERVVRR